MCVFCDDNNVEDLLLEESEHAFVMCNKFPITSLGHFLVIPKKHYKCLSEIPPEVQQDIFSLLNSFVRKVKKIIPHEGINVIFNEGECAGQTISHFHIHIIFREKGDGINNFERVEGERRSIEPGEISRFRKKFNL